MKEVNVEDENIYFEYRKVKKIFPYPQTIHFAKNLPKTKDIVFISGMGRPTRQIFDENEVKKIKAKYSPPLSFTSRYEEMLKYVVKLQSDFNKKNNVSTTQLDRNLQDLIIKKLGFFSGLAYGGVYNGDFNMIELKELSPFDEEINDRRLFILAHEIGHLNFTEFRLEDDNLLKLSGLNKTYYKVRSSIPLADNKSYLLDVNRDNWTVENYGIDDLLNDEQTVRMLDGAGIFRSEMSNYNSLGSIIEYIAGKDVCQKAREQHNLQLIKDKFLELIPDENKFYRLLDELDVIFYDDKWYDQKVSNEIKCYKLISPYFELSAKQKIKNGTFEKGNFLFICEHPNPFEEGAEERIKKINQSVKDEVLSFEQSFKQKGDQKTIVD